MRVSIIGAMSGHGPRVAITGIGVVSPYGVGRDCFWRHVSRGCSATRSIVDFDASPFPCTVAAPVPPVTIDDGVMLTERAVMRQPSLAIRASCGGQAGAAAPIHAAIPRRR